MKLTIRKIYYTLLLVLTSAGLSLAQGPKDGGHISGTLLDEQGKPLMYATATLLNAKDSTIIKGAISNEEGIYTFDHVKDGQYIVKASTVGYEKAASDPFTVGNGS